MLRECLWIKYKRMRDNTVKGGVLEDQGEEIETRTDTAGFLLYGN